jgi:primosomal protein N' (replication factor Y)
MNYQVCVFGSNLMSLTYAAPEQYELEHQYQHRKQKALPDIDYTGWVVEVTLRNRKSKGLVLGPSPSQEKVDFEVKTFKPLDQYRPVAKAYLDWLVWLSEYYLYPLGMIAPLAFADPLKEKKPAKKSSKKKEKEKVIAKDPGIPLIQKIPDRFSRIQLNEEQASALDQIELGYFKTYLLFGITGSGKTEVYLSLFEKVVASGGRGLFLVPEISLTPQMIQRFESRFPGQVGIIHSELTPLERRKEWWAIHRQEKKILLGVRSALFCPIEGLSAIVVDEEHDGSFKQEDRFKYHARDSAIALAQKLDVPIVLGSATPSAESWWHAKKGKYQLLQLKRRAKEVPLPKTTLIDMRGRATVRHDIEWLSVEAYEMIRSTLAREMQVAVMLNRRGYSPLMICSQCGITPMCPSCDINLTYHQNQYLVCHYCGYHERLHTNTKCKACSGGEKADVDGPCELRPLGVGTQKIEADLKVLFPEARIARADRDEIKDRKYWSEILEKMENHEIDILIGTQMISKGLDFKGLETVCMPFVDLGFYFPDFRAEERGFQLITQMSGRAGRHENETGVQAQVCIQSFNPELKAITAAQAHDYLGFIEAELAERELLNYPPFTRLALIRVQAIDKQRAWRQAQGLARELKSRPKSLGGVQILGPVVSPISRIKNLYRFQILIKAVSSLALHSLLKTLSNKVTKSSGSVRITVEIDPLHFI